MYDGDVAHHHRSFHFPHEKDLIGTAHVRLNDCLIDQAGQQVVGFHPHHERDQNRFFYQLSNPVNAEVAHSLAEKESTVWLEAHVVSSEMYEQEKAAGLVNVKVTDGLKQSENAKLAVKHALIARSRAGSRIVSKKSSPGTSQASLLLGLPGGSPTNGSSMSMSTIGSSHSSNPSKRMSVPEEAAEKMMAAALAAAAKRDLEDSDAEDANRRGGEDSDDLDSEAEAERDEQRAASGNIHYLPSEHLFKADQPGNAALTSTIKHLLGRVQNLEWAVKKQRKQQNTASASAGAAVAQPSGLPLPVESPPDESATLHFKPNNTSSGTPANGTAAAGAGAGGVDPASIAKLVSSYESLLVSNHKLVLQVSDLAQTVQSQSAELKALQLTVAAQAQLSAANGSNGGSGLGSPMSPNRKGNSITPRPYTASSPTERWYSK